MAVSAEDRILQINSINGNEFMGWDGEYKNNMGRAFVKCGCGRVRSSTVSNLVNKRRGCHECYSDRRRSPHGDIEEKINDKDGVMFVRWVDGYRTVKSVAEVAFSCGHHAKIMARDIIWKGVGCPACRRFGFRDEGYFGFVYVMQSLDGELLKVGITNFPRQREAVLRRETPFDFRRIVIRVHPVGREVRRIEYDVHSRFDGAGLDGFDGCTEWIRYNKEVIDMVKGFGFDPPIDILNAANEVG